VDPGFLQRSVEDAARRADERPPGEILLVARLLADEQDLRVERPLAEHRLRRVLVEVAPGAAARVLEQLLPRSADVAARYDRPLRLKGLVQSIERNIGHRRSKRAKRTDGAARAERWLTERFGLLAHARAGHALAERQLEHGEGNEAEGGAGDVDQPEGGGWQAG